MQYKIIMRQTQEGYAVWCDELPGCASQGDSEEEAIANIREAIVEYLAVREELSLDQKQLLVEV